MAGRGLGYHPLVSASLRGRSRGAAVAQPQHLCVSQSGLFMPHLRNCIAFRRGRAADEAVSWPSRQKELHFLGAGKAGCLPAVSFKTGGRT